MPSLKDLRNRIASVKATRKITKAMQMVAAAKLRRAQEAATAARPYAERMDRVLANLGARVTDRAGASPLLVGTGKDDVHLLIVMTAERGLCGGFNSNIAQLARHDAQADRRGQDGQDPDGRPQGRRGDAPRLRPTVRRSRRPARRAPAHASPTPTASPRRCSRCSKPASSTLRRCISPSSSRSSRRSRPRCSSSRRSCPAAKARQGHRRRQAVHEYEPTRRGNPGLPRHAQHRHADLPRAAGERRLRARRAHERHGHATRNAGEMIDKLTLRTTARARP